MKTTWFIGGTTQHLNFAGLVLNGIYQFLAAFDEVAVASQVIQKLDFYSSAIYKVSFSEHKTYIIKISSPKLLDRAFNTHMIS